MKDFGLVSIITPSYNCADYISDTIEAIQKQSYKNWELLITDDCSTDETINVITRYMTSESRIKLFRLSENSGAAIARNNSIREAKGRYIAFCDSDDQWSLDKLEKQLDFMSANNYAFTFTACDLFSENGTLWGHQSVPARVTYLSLLRNCAVPSSTAMYDAKILGKMYMPNIRKRQDWGLWLDIVKKCKYGYGLNETLMKYAMRSNSISSDKKKLLRYNFMVYHDHLGYSKLMSSILLFGYFMPAYIVKRIKIKLKI